MSGSAQTLFGLSPMTESQNQKYLTFNNGLNRIADFLAASLSVSVSGGNATVTAAQLQPVALVNISGASVAGRTVTLPVLKRVFYVTLDLSSAFAVTLVRGTKQLTILPGQCLTLYQDGTSNALRRLGDYGLARRTVWVRGVPDDGELVARWQVQEDSSLLPNCLGWDGQADVAATGSSVFSIRRDGVQVGTITYAAAGTVPTYTTSAGARIDFTAGQFIDILAPNPKDATLADIFFETVLVRQ